MDVSRWICHCTYYGVLRSDLDESSESAKSPSDGNNESTFADATRSWRLDWKSFFNEMEMALLRLLQAERHSLHEKQGWVLFVEGIPQDFHCQKMVSTATCDGFILADAQNSTRNRRLSSRLTIVTVSQFKPPMFLYCPFWPLENIFDRNGTYLLWV